MSAEAPRLGLLRTTAFRVTLLHLALTLLGTLALSAVAWWATVGFATRQAAQQIERDTAVLLQSAALSGLAGLRLSVDARLAADRNGLEHYLLAAPDGQRLAGNLASAPLAPGWRSLGLERRGPDAAGPAAPLLALATRLPGGATLVVARDLTPVAQLEERLWSAAGWVGGAALLVGLLGGLVVGRGVARRAGAMGAVLDAVQAGVPGQRLPVAGPGDASDEFDRLARRINATLDRLEAAMAALRQVTDDIAHDLRTPLSRLRQRLEGAARAASPDAWRAEAEVAIAECDAILDLFAALLRIAQVESGTALRRGFAAFDLSALAESVAEAYAPAAEERGGQLEARVAPGIGGFGDRTLLAQMLANLLENAVRHGRPGGRVRLTLARGTGAGPMGGPASDPGAGAVLVVEDDGPGIPAAERERVFGRFVRLDAARTTPGSGLGLALVRAVAALHGVNVSLGDAEPGLRVVLQFPPVPAQ